MRSGRGIGSFSEVFTSRVSPATFRLACYFVQVPFQLEHIAEWSEGSQAERKGHLSGDIFMLWGGRPNDKSPIGEPYKSNNERQEQEEKGSLPADLAIPLQSWQPPTESTGHSLL